MRSKIRWFTVFCNSHYVSHFAAFFIVARAKISVVESCLWLHVPAMLQQYSFRDKRFGVDDLKESGRPGQLQKQPSSAALLARSTRSARSERCWLPHPLTGGTAPGPYRVGSRCWY